jgi:hypothetical protein
MATKDEVLLSYLSQHMGLDVSTSLVFVSFFASLFIIIYVLLGNKVKKQGIKILVAASPFLIADFIMPFGTYKFDLLFIGEVISPIFVNTLNIIDYIAYFKVFDPAIAVITSYDATSYQLGSVATSIIFIYNYADTIAQVVLLTMGVYSILTWIENSSNKKMETINKALLSFIIGIVPSLYSIFYVANPVTEYELITGYAKDIGYFFNYATSDDISYVVMLGLLAFVLFSILIMIIVHVVFMFVTSTDYNGGLDDMKYNYSMYTSTVILLYMVIFLVHPNYMWYNIFIYLGIYYIVKKFFSSVVKEARTHNNSRRDKEHIADLVSGKMARQKRMSQTRDGNIDSGSSTFTAILFLLGIGLVAYTLYTLGFLSFLGI